MIGIASGSLLKNRYRLERLLGRGGMASVWLGHDEVLDRPVAVKVLSDAIASDPGFRARFRREATVAAGLSHPNLVDVYDYSEADERRYLVMEFVPGRDLGSLIKRDASIDRDKLARELLGAVAHIHAAGIVHRDIKPHNIVLEADGTAKLIDFGIALPRDASSLTQTGLVLATRRYAAPEVMAGRPATERSDLYACGVVLDACRGNGRTELESLVGSLTREDPNLRPRSAREALRRLEERPPDAGESTAAFSPTFDREPGGGETAADRADSSPPTRAYSRSASTRKRWTAAAAILAVAAALVAVVVVAVSSGGGGSNVANSGRQEHSRPGKAPGKGGQAAAKSAEPAGPAQAEPEQSQSAATPVVVEPTGNDPALASSLNEQGFELIQAGHYEEAVPILEESVRAFPPGTEETAYAYALYNLGDALRLSGRPKDAIPVLERRLLIPNQTGVVSRELEAARREAG
jgi:serine/threonine-protein kinase